MTSRSQRRFRQQKSLSALLAEARANPEMVRRRREAELGSYYPPECGLKTALCADPAFPDAARWHPGLLDD
jgi:hypothetical protein